MSGARWAIVEVMGHRQYAGLVEEVVVAGAPMLRVSVPAYATESRDHSWRTLEGERVEGYDERATSWVRTITLSYEPYTVDLGGAALFAVTGCSEARARVALPGCHDGPEPPVRAEGPWRPDARGELPGPVEEAEEIDDLDEDSDGAPF